MLLFDENYNQLDAKELVKEFGNLDDVTTPTESELEQELGKYYEKALQAEAKSNNFAISFTSNFAAAINVGGILKKIKDFICRVLTGSSTVEDIIEAVLDALSSIIPGGIILKPIVKKIVKYILSKGIDTFCAVSGN